MNWEKRVRKAGKGKRLQILVTLFSNSEVYFWVKDYAKKHKVPPSRIVKAILEDYCLLDRERK